MQDINSSLDVAIALHSKLVKNLPFTNYNLYCRKIHKSSYSSSEKWGLILNWDLNPNEYENPTLFGADWQCKHYLSKLTIGGVPTANEKEVAYAKFLKAEEICSNFNTYRTTSVRPKGLQVMLPEVQRIVASVLGPVKDFFEWVEKIETPSDYLKCDRFSDFYGKVDPVNHQLSPEFGPGASVGRDGNLSSFSEKLVCGTVTSQCAYLANWVSGIWNLPNCTIVQGSTLTFVPKRVGEARTICYEPSMNMLIQKLLGQYIKIRMKYVLGIDLTNQSKNKSMAQLGSLCDSYATIDMSSASDLWSTWFVEENTPYPWFRLLNDARSKSYFDSETGNWASFHKFSTMGNGFTFELETLLFAAVILASVRVFTGETLSREEYSVYGDDIIVPKHLSSLCEQSLILCGHIPNLTKSFTSGPFRESCGGEYFNGWDVTPIKIKDLQLDDAKNLVGIHNRHVSLPWSPSHISCFSSWFVRVRLALHLRIVNLTPNVSEGPIESYVENGTLSFQSSDRYLWSEDHPSTWRNSRFSKKLQCVVPARLIIYKPLRTILRDLHPDVLGYCIAHNCADGGKIDVGREVRCVRNASAFH